MLMKILMQNRTNVFTQRGGDTIVLERLSAGLRQFGITVDIDVTAGADLRSYDLVHLFNFATPEYTEYLARRAAECGKPFVVTTLYEDWPIFYNQMQLLAQAFVAYINAGQPQDRWGELAAAIRNCEPRARLENSFAATQAAALLTTGEKESQSLIRDYGTQIRTAVHHLGCDLDTGNQSADLFVKEYGEEDFVLCVGRLETRKNQLALLKALEQSELTLVFAAGGFTYQPEYAQACKAFRRKGKTLFLDRLSPDMLSSAFCAARVHALPSWYELPGLVSLEAARLGCNIVVSPLGTAADYFGELALYARPDEPEDICNAVTAAYYRPPDPKLRERASSYTWQKTADEVRQVYQRILS
jgi:glycosyltransferase involved in cell wall biosynthesis